MQVNTNKSDKEISTTSSYRSSFLTNDLSSYLIFVEDYERGYSNLDKRIISNTDTEYISKLTSKDGKTKITIRKCTYDHGMIISIIHEEGNNSYYIDYDVTQSMEKNYKYFVIYQNRQIKFYEQD